MIRSRRLSRRGAALVAALIALPGLALPAAAESIQELERRAQRAAERAADADARGDDLAQRVAALDRRRNEAEARVDALKADLDRLDRRIEAKKDQLTAAQRRMAVLTRELQDILADLGARTDVFVERAVAAYKAGPTAYVEGVLSADSFNDVMDRYEYYRAALDADSALLDDIETLRDGLEERRTEVEQRQQEISEAKLALQTDRATVQALHDEKAQVLAERQAVVDAKAALLSQVRGREAHLRKIAATFEREAAELRAIAAAGSSASGAFPSGGGQLLWPAAGPVTSGYGYRTHPIFGDTRMHTGIDIGAGYGAPVIAADGGEVIYAGVMSGYGNVVVIDHGGGLATTYNHLSSFFVSSGQSVARGAQVGAVGCTGYCTGPHLHFEVRINGDPVDPMPYLQ